MKNFAIIVMCLLMIVMSSACGKSESTNNNGDNTAKSAASGAYDYDFSKMSTSVAYSQLCEFMNAQKDYLNKTVKIKGEYWVNHYDETDKDYYYITITDTTACCSAYIEFLTEGCELPKKASDENNTVTVTATGTIKSYDELGTTYYYLAVDSIA